MCGKHTPGPWIARMNCDVIAGERRVADCMTGWLRESRANARLIAAAPELYEALVALHDAMAADQSGYEDRDELYQLVTSAITKAEGESEAAA